MILQTPGATVGKVFGGVQFTTGLFLLATFGVALSAVLGLSQAAAAATADRLPTATVRSEWIPATWEPPKPTVVGTDAGSRHGTDLRSALRRLDRLPEPADQAIASITATSTTATVPPTTAGPTTTPSTAPAPTTTTRSTSSVAADPMAVRQWRPISTAEFQRFVEARGFNTTDYVTPGLVHGTLNGSSQRINVVLVHRSATAPMRVSPQRRGREPVGAWAQAIGGTAGINANWYSPLDGPAVAGGEIYGGLDHGYTALFGFTLDGDLVADHHHKIHEQVGPRVSEAVAGHPTLIHRGEATTNFGGDPTFIKRNPRSAIGVSANVDVLILVTVDGRQAGAVGMTGAETTRLLKRLGAHDAVMLDGGGSSAMWIAGKGIVNQPSDPGRSVGNQIAVFGH